MMRYTVNLFRLCFLGCVIAGNIEAQERDFSTVEIITHQVTDSIYMLEGAGGNIGVFIGHDGVFMIDDQFAPLSEKISAAIGKLTEGDIQYLINTHIHGDHTGGNANFSQRGALIIAHTNVRKRLSEGAMNLRSGKQDEPSPEAALPVVTFDDSMSFHLNGEQVNIISFGPAHTDGDVFIHFTDSNVMHLGDVFRTNTYPIIDVGNGGNFHGIISGLGKALALADENTRIIPGHGFLTDKAMLKQVHEMYVEILNGVKSMKDSGRSIEDIVRANPGEKYDERWSGQGVFGGKESMLRRIYEELD